MLDKAKEILLNIKNWLAGHKLEVFVVLELILIAFALYHLLKPPETITVMPQEQAETTQGVKQASENAHVKIDNAQAQEIASAIREIRVVEKAPEYTVQTTGDKAKEASEKAQEAAGADFAIVTNKDTIQEVKQEVKQLDELPDDAQVTLNQYNVQAYKKHINTIEYQPTEKVVGYTHQWKVSKSGRYMGVGANYDIDDKKIMMKVTYSW